MPQLTLCTEVYDALVAHVGSALDCDIRWQPNEDEPDGFVERVHSLELMGLPTCQWMAHSVEHRNWTIARR